MRTLEIPNAGSHIPLFGDMKILRIVIGMGIKILCIVIGMGIKILCIVIGMGIKILCIVIGMGIKHCFCSCCALPR